MREINLTVEEEKNKSYNEPLELYQIFLDGNTLYKARHPEDIVFFDEEGNPQIYEAAAISRTDIDVTEELRTDSVDVDFDNVGLDMSQLLQDYEFRGRWLVIWKVFRGKLDSFDNKIELFRGLMDEPTVDENELSVRVIGEFDLLDRIIPRRKYSMDCTFDFGDEACGVEISEANDTRVTGTVNAVEDEYAVMIYLDEITDDNDDYWIHGYLTILGQSRYVIESGTDAGMGYVKVRMPFFWNVEGENFELIAGCDKTFGMEDGNEEVNHGCAFWENQQFYGGFLHVPDEEE